MWNGRSETHITSKSTNKNVLSVYNEIFVHAYSDSDYWHLSGDGYILDKLYDFDHSDLLELKNDFVNWKFNELGIFKSALENDYNATHDDLLSIRGDLYGFIMTLANKYLNTDKRIAASLISDIEIEFLTEGHIKDKILLEEIKRTLDNAETSTGIVGDPTKDYMSKIRFDFIKEIIQKLYNEVK
jgi:hypothetical protein